MLEVLSVVLPDVPNIKKVGPKVSKSIRSDSEGSSDEESKVKRKLPRTFHQ